MPTSSSSKFQEEDSELDYKGIDVSLKNRSQKLISWEKISYHVHQKSKERKILQNVHGSVAPGEVLAIMGPSGCGKTTILDILGDRIATGILHGDVFVNGKQRKANDKHFRNYTSYVAQEDSLMGCFTVEETLNFSADLSLPNTYNHEQRRQSVQQVIVAMGLESCASTRVGDIFTKGISGGQKRRLSIAIELVRDPSILLLDEPTSGLDSASTYNVMSYVHKLALTSKTTILLTIHQPSSSVWNLFSNVLFLSEGKTMYFGKPTGAIDYFASLGHVCPQYNNPAEYFLALINTDFEGHANVDRIAEAYERNYQENHLKNNSPLEEAQQATSEASGESYELPSMWFQFLILTKRNLLNNARNPGIFWVRILMYICLSFMVGTMYFRTKKDLKEEDLIPMLFYVQAFLVFMSVAVLPFFIEQRAIFIRERANGSLNVFSFVFSNIISVLPGIALIALVSTALVVGLSGVHGFGYFFLNLFLSLIVAESLMHVIGAAVPHYIIGIAVGAGIFGMFMLCEGFMIPKSAIPDYWIWAYYIGFHSYSFGAFMVNQFQHTNPDILVRYDLENVEMSTNMGILVLYAILLQILFFGILYHFHTGRR